MSSRWFVQTVRDVSDSRRGTVGHSDDYSQSLTFEQLAQLLADGAIDDSDLVMPEKGMDWQPAEFGGFERNVRCIDQTAANSTRRPADSSKSAVYLVTAPMSSKCMRMSRSVAGWNMVVPKRVDRIFLFTDSSSSAAKTARQGTFCDRAYAWT